MKTFSVIKFHYKSVKKSQEKFFAINLSVKIGLQYQFNFYKKTTPSNKIDFQFLLN
jgi:hypothetical protein